jgi:hypothetical protein
VDLLLIIGTSLRVAPANTIVYKVPRRCVRVLINQTEEGTHLGLNFHSPFVPHNNTDATTTTTRATTTQSSRWSRDYFAQGDIDAVILELAGYLGWWDDLAQYLDNDQLPAPSAALLRAKLQSRDQERAAAVAAESTAAAATAAGAAVAATTTTAAATTTTAAATTTTTAANDKANETHKQQEETFSAVAGT